MRIDTYECDLCHVVGVAKVEQSQFGSGGLFSEHELPEGWRYFQKGDSIAKYHACPDCAAKIASKGDR